MNKLSSQEIRARFLAFFAKRGHAILPSASLIPANDPTVLFTTAGMHPLVPYLLGEKHPQGNRLASAQKCLRTGDIDEVGDNRHLTFFEMLGNWSLGDYFKKESITWSWEFLTSTNEGLGLDPNRLYITVFAGDEDAEEDQESILAWQACFKALGIEAGVDVPLNKGGRIFRMPKSSNWWGPAGKTGPCGPDSEIYFEIQNSDLSKTRPDGFPDFESGRLLEIWNNVFMQFYQEENGSFSNLTQKNVDTGMGLERVAMILQEVSSPFETDLFEEVLKGLKQTLTIEVGEDEHKLRVIADHLRAAFFLIADGVRPSNKDQGYVLRRLLRRAILLSETDSFTWIDSSLEVYSKIYAGFYGQLEIQKQELARVVKQEGDKFRRTLQRGLQEIHKLDRITGKIAFDLYQSYGFPLELTREYAASQGITLDEHDFETEFSRHQDLSRTASVGQFASGLADQSEQVVRYHTATHLLHQALRQVLGEGVAQRGSNLTAERLRFDFSYPQKLSSNQLKEIEALVNQKINEGLVVEVCQMSPEEALKNGAIGLFGHKYGDKVSVYQIGDFSNEICTGPHVGNTKEIGVFKIVKEEAISEGTRRIKAVLV
jgi:alanyl-tRNA synthetase